MYGTYETIDERPALTFERRLAHPVERVWRAVTDPDELAHWFPSRVSGRIAPGAKLTFAFPDDDLPALKGEVVELEPPRRFAFTWGEDVLRIELDTVGDGCLLRFTCIFDDPARAARDAAGWHVCLELLEEHLGGARTQAPSSDATPDWRGLYEDYQRRGLPAGAPLPGGVARPRRPGCNDGAWPTSTWPPSSASCALVTTCSTSASPVWRGRPSAARRSGSASGSETGRPRR